MLVTLGLLITFHEFGHYWVARKLGVGVLRFSVGFGKPLWSRRGREGTEYVIAAIPLGGYVKMLDEREGDVPESDLGKAFNRKPVWTRIAIVAAGPVFNLVFVTQLVKAVLFFLALLMLVVYEAEYGALDWYGIPLFPLVLSFGLVNLIAAIGFIMGYDWAFHLVLAMAALGLAETVFAAGIPIILLSIWIITLLFPCWAKWVLYSKILHRVKLGKLSSSHIDSTAQHV